MGEYTKRTGQSCRGIYKELELELEQLGKLARKLARTVEESTKKTKVNIGGICLVNWPEW